MKIKQEKDFMPVTITLETKDDYDAFFQIVDQALDKISPSILKLEGKSLACALSAFAANNT